MQPSVVNTRRTFYIRARLAGVVCVAFTPSHDLHGPPVQVAIMESDNDPSEAARLAAFYFDGQEATEAAHRLGPLFWLTQDASILAHPKSVLEVVEIKQDRAVVYLSLAPHIPNPYLAPVPTKLATNFPAAAFDHHARAFPAPSPMPTQDPANHAPMMGQPLTRADFEALIQYRGPAVVARKDLFGQVNQALAARFEPMLEASASPNAYAAMRQDLRAMAQRIRNPFFQAQALDALDPLDAYAAHGESLTYPAATSALMGLRLWLNLAVLENTLGPFADLLTPPIYHADEAPND